MALPDKKIKKIQLPGDVQGDKTYEIIPERLQNSGFEASLPQLTRDVTLAIAEDLQDISVSAVERQYAKSSSNAQVSTATAWSTVSTSSTQRERSVAYGNGYWVVAGASGDLWYSTNGSTWTKATAFTSGTIIGVAYGNGYFLASCHDDHTIYKAVTPVGPWSALVTLSSAFESIQYVNNTFVATGENGLISFSVTGEAWNDSATGASNAFYCVAYGLGRYIAVGSGGKILSSVNGETWTDVSNPNLSTDIRTIAYGNGRFVVGGKSIYYSTDGETWTASATIPETISGWIRGFAYAEGRYYCGMYQSNGVGAIWQSSDGSNWTVAYGSLGRVWCIGYSDGIFVASGDSGKIYALDLGITWYQDAPTLGTGEYLWSRIAITQNNGSMVYSDAKLDSNANYYPTAVSWTNGTTSGPTGTIAMAGGASNVNIPSLPVAGASQSGVVTTGYQVLPGAKEFNDTSAWMTATGKSLFVNSNGMSLSDATDSSNVLGTNYQVGKITNSNGSSASSSHDITIPLKDGTMLLDTDVYGEGSVEGTSLIAIPGDFKGNAIDITEFVGNSFVLNQLVQNGNFVNADRWTTDTANCTLSVANNIGTITVNQAVTTRYGVRLEMANNLSLKNGNSHYLSFWVKSTKAFTLKIDSNTIFSPEAVLRALTANTWTYVSAIVVGTGVNQKIWFYPEVDTSFVQGDTLQFKDIQIIDLNLVGLASTETTSVSTAKTALKKRGFDVDMWGHMPNMFDGQLTQINSKAVRATNFIPATPNTRLNISFQSSISSTYGFMQFYDASQTNIGEQRYNSGDDVTIPAGCAYVKPQFNHSSSDITPSNISNVWLTYSFYQPGALMDCKPIKLISKKYNLLNLRRVANFPTGGYNQHEKRSWDESKYYVGLKWNDYNLGGGGVPNWTVTDNSMTFRVTEGGTGLAFPFKVKPGQQYTVSLKCSANPTSGYNIGMAFSYYDANGYWISSSNFESTAQGEKSGSATVPNNCAWLVLVVFGSSAFTTMTFTDVCFHLTGTRTGYAPYGDPVEVSLTVPYLKSARDIRDESKAGGSKVAKNNLGDLNWLIRDMGSDKTYRYELRGTPLNPLAVLPSALVMPNIICSKYTPIEMSGPTALESGTANKVIGISDRNRVSLVDNALDGMTTDQIKSALSGVMLNYPKATPTDFTDPISLPQRIPVEAGGSVEVVCASLAIPYATKYRWQTLVDVPTAVSELSNDAGYATTAYVDQRIDDLPEPMVFKGSLGVGGTITTLPTASADNKGFTYKVITAGTYQGLVCKVGDTVISDGSAWTLIPSGDEPSGTVTSVGLQAGSGSNLTVSGSPITSSGTMTVSVASGYSIPSTSQQTSWTNKQDALPGVFMDSSVGMYGTNSYFLVFDDENESDVAPRPANSINPSWDCDLYIYGTGFTVSNAGHAGEHNYKQYSFPNHGGTFAMTNDIGLTLLDLRGYVDA